MSAQMSTRPFVTDEEVRHLAERKYGLCVSAIEELPSFVDRNFLLTSSDNKCEDSKRDFILKITNAKDSEKWRELCSQHAAMSALDHQGFVCTQVVKNIEDEYFSGFFLSGYSQDEEKKCVVRLLTYIHGSTLEKYINYVDTQVLHEIGQLLGGIHRTLKTLPCNLDIDDAESLWRMENIKLTEAHLIPGDKRNTLLLEVINHVQKNALEKSSTFTKGIVHGDIRGANLIVNFKNGKFEPLLPNSDSSPKSKYGIIDFGDLTHSSYVFDVAMTIADFMVECDGINFWDIGGHLLAGYLASEKLTEAEFNTIYYMIAARYCQYIILGEHAYRMQGDNEYCKLLAVKAWKKIQILWNTNVSDVNATWKHIMRKNYDVILDC